MEYEIFALRPHSSVDLVSLAAESEVGKRTSGSATAPSFNGEVQGGSDCP
jgi:hypothetical protein